MVKIRSLFLGDPRCGKKFEKNTSERDRKTRFSPLEGQMTGAYKSWGSEAIRPTAAALWNARVDFFVFFDDPPFISVETLKFPNGLLAILWYPRTQIEWGKGMVRVNFSRRVRFGHSGSSKSKVHFLGGKSIFFAPLCYAPGFQKWNF